MPGQCSAAGRLASRAQPGGVRGPRARPTRAVRAQRGRRSPRGRGRPVPTAIAERSARASPTPDDREGDRADADEQERVVERRCDDAAEEPREQTRAQPSRDRAPATGPSANTNANPDEPDDRPLLGEEAQPLVVRRAEEVGRRSSGAERLVGEKPCPMSGSSAHIWIAVPHAWIRYWSVATRIVPVRTCRPPAMSRPEPRYRRQQDQAAASSPPRARRSPPTAGCARRR